MGAGHTHTHTHTDTHTDTHTHTHTHTFDRNTVLRSLLVLKRCSTRVRSWWLVPP